MASGRVPRPTRTGLAAMALAAGLITWLVADHSNPPRVAPLAAGPSVAATTTTLPTTSSSAATTSTSPTTTVAPPPRSANTLPQVIAPARLTVAALRALVAELGQRVYWVGPEAGHRYELTRDTGGSVFLRYLPAGEPAGTPRALPTVGSYPLADAFAVTDAAAHETGAIRVKVPGGAVAFLRLARPTSIYLAYPGLDYQIEVYDPSPAQALHLVRSDSVRLVR